MLILLQGLSHMTFLLVAAKCKHGHKGIMPYCFSLMRGRGRGGGVEEVYTRFFKGYPKERHPVRKAFWKETSKGICDREMQAP